MTSITKIPNTFLRGVALVVLGSGALALSGCGSKPTQTELDTGTEAGAGDARAQWFCQVGENDDEWDCVRDDALARAHQPTRLPQPRDKATTTPLQPTPPRSPDSQPTAEQPALMASPTAADTISDEVPTHVALSYQPEKPVAILDLPEDLFAVQLVAVSSKESLEEYARNNRLSGLSAARTWNGERLFYVLLLGIYETRENAELAVASLSGPMKELNAPWIRSVGSLQRAMREADRVSGTQDY